MRFKTELKNIRTFSSTLHDSSPVTMHILPVWLTLFYLPELTAALSSLEKIAWVRLDDDTARFTVIPAQGSQVWA